MSHFPGGLARARSKDKLLAGVLFFTLVISAALLTVQLTTAAGIDEVTRAAPGTPAPGAEFEVTLQLTGEPPLVVGIIENLPPGFSFVSTSGEHYEVVGQRLLLAVINESEVRYTVKAPSSGAGTFSGTWTDMLNERDGSIAPTAVSVEAPTTGPVSPAPSSTAAAPSAAPVVPGFDPLFALLSLLLAALLTSHRVKGGRGA